MNHCRSRFIPQLIIVVLCALCIFRTIEASGHGVVVPVTLSRTYANNITLHDNYYDLFWEVNESQQSLAIAISCKTLGWVGIGMSNAPNNNTDMILGWIHSTTEYVTLDDSTIMKSSGSTVADVDLPKGKNDAQLSSGYETNDRTVIEFRRKLNTGDPNDLVIKNGLVHIVYAWASTDPEQDGKYVPAVVNGSIILNLYANAKPYTDENVETVNVVFEKNVVPGNTELSMCLGFRLTDLMKEQRVHIDRPFQNKHHGIMFNSIVDSTSTVQHMVLYSCNGDANPSLGVNMTNDPLMPVPCDNIESKCSRVIMAVAKDTTRFIVPAEAGFPISYSVNDHIMLQVYYDNKGPSTTDSSGISIHYTSTLRENDAGAMKLGSSDDLIVPPSKETYNYVARDCSCAEQFNKTISVFAYAPDEHSIGRLIKTEHYDQTGVLIGYIGNEHYDFSKQGVISMPRPFRQLLKTHQLITTCTFNSSERSTATKGGLRTDEEICVNYVFYYPAQSITDCDQYEKHRKPAAKCVIKLPATRRITTRAIVITIFCIFVFLIGFGIGISALIYMVALPPPTPKKLDQEALRDRDEEANEYPKDFIAENSFYEKE